MGVRHQGMETQADNRTPSQHPTGWKSSRSHSERASPLPSIVHHLPQRRETLQSPDVLIKRLIFIARQKREFNAHRQLMRFPFWFSKGPVQGEVTGILVHVSQSQGFMFPPTEHLTPQNTPTLGWSAPPTSGVGTYKGGSCTPPPSRFQHSFSR